MKAPLSGVRAALAAALMTVAFEASAAPPEDIRDIRGPKWLPPDWLIPGLIAACVLLGIAVFGAWRRRRRRRRPGVLSPLELALRRLEESRVLMQPASANEFSVAVSDIVRSYIEQQFKVTATLRTTEEFLRDLIGASNAALASHRDLLSEFLHQCDLAKFAGLALTMQSMESLYQSARTFVGETGRSPSSEPHDSIPAT
jgi:Domain of unknown function (DUF4381)